MPTVLYRFDDPNAFSVLESQTSELRNWSVAAVQEDGESAIRVVWQADQGFSADAQLCLALPRVAIDGAPARLGLVLRGDGSGVRILLDATDARGPGYSYSLGPVLFQGVETCWAEVAYPAEYWDGAPPGELDIRPPLQLHRLMVEPPLASGIISIDLLRLVVTGDVRLASVGHA